MCVPLSQYLEKKRAPSGPFLLRQLDLSVRVFLSHEKASWRQEADRLMVCTLAANPIAEMINHRAFDLFANKE